MSDKVSSPAAEGKQKSVVHRRSFGLRDQVSGPLKIDYHSQLLNRIRDQDHRVQLGQTEVLLSKEFGFCYGVDRAVELAYETVERFSDRRIFITAEIIHNPLVNGRLKDMGVHFLSSSSGEYKDSSIEDVEAQDVVILPAFGVSAQMKQALDDKGCVMVDTTCGSVVRVWKRVEQNARDGYTSIIHGTYEHEETIATSSMATAQDGKYVVVRDDGEAQVVCDYIEGKIDGEALMERLSATASEGFDPDQDLKRIGFANQTTMLATDSLRVAEMIKQAMLRAKDEEYVAENFRHFDTICSATQDRQDAIQELVKLRPDLMLVVGGFNSSNTQHLAEIGAKYCPSYHIDSADCLVSKDEIRRLPTGQAELVMERDWLPTGPLKFGVTAGASTPNRVTGEVIERFFALREEESIL